MTELEKVEKLREKADVSFSEAREALDNSGGDILDALIYLEKQGKSTAPAGGGFYSGSGAKAPEHKPASAKRDHEGGKSNSFVDFLRAFGRFLLKLLNIGNNNFLDAFKKDEVLFSCPVTALVVLLLFFFWILVPLFIISLFFGMRYRFRGENLGTESVNRVMDTAGTMVDDVKSSFTDNRN